MARRGALGVLIGPILGLLALGGLAGSRAEGLPDPDRRLLSTGQVTGYRGAVAERADGNADDGDLLRGRLLDYEWKGLGEPASQAENVVLDRNTGLMWIRRPALLDAEDERGLHGNLRLDSTRDWSAALAAAGQLRYAGYADWRLPNVHELQSLIDFGRWSPALDPRAFPGSLDDWPSPYLWSSTTNPLRSDEAFYTNLVDGHAWPWHKAVHFTLMPVRTVGAEDPVAIFQTGQTLSYRGSEVVAEPGAADDGELRLGLEPRYLWQDDGTIDRADENLVLDERTGLVWLRRPALLDGSGGLGGNLDLSVAMGWQTAIDRCNTLDYAGHDDWRLPNLRELDSLARYGSETAGLDPAAFPNPPAPPAGAQQPPWIWWSSTTNVRPREGHRAEDEAWYLTIARPIKRHHVFDEAFGSAKSRPGHVRCVRDAEPRARPEGWLPEIRSSADWAALGIPSALPGVDRLGKFLLPTEAERPAAPFAAAFQDAHRYLLHYDFLRAVFPSRFASLSTSDYESLVGRRATRRYFAGGLREIHDAEGRRVYGFDLYVDTARAEELPSQAELARLYERLGRAFRRRPLVYSPTQPEAIALARSWTGSHPPVAFPAPPPDAGYAVYTPGESYGRLRLTSLDALPAALDGGLLGWQDILVLDRAPTDVEAVVAGLITGQPQAELSHLALRAARRGTPNAYLASPHAALETWEDRLVRLTLSRDGWEVRADVTLEEAEAHWAARRPAPVALPALDGSWSAIEGLAAIAAGEREGDAVTRVGAKAANLARLHAFLPEANRLSGLAIPFHYYQAHMRAGRILDPALQPARERSLAEQVEALHADPRFLSDAAWRAQRLALLREAIREAPVPDTWEDAIEARLLAAFGPGRMVRFRSSSNAEDGLVFNGAGLYDSTSVCAEDGSDGDSDGPSRCDPDQAEERTIKRGLRKVWASLWSQRAWEERAWYGIDPQAVGMALLVTPAFPDERANGVAFTGNPFAPAAHEMLVNAQLGDTSVVLPEPGVLPERDLILVEDGQVAGIRRLQASSLLPPGGQVLSDAVLQRLGALLLLTEARFPLDRGQHEPEDLLLDLEFKVDGPDEALYLKQVRPFLLAREPGAEPPAFLRVTVPITQTLCSGWRLAHSIAEEHGERLRLELPTGELELPLEPGRHPGTVFGRLEAGPAYVPLAAAGAGAVELGIPSGQPERREARLERRYGPSEAPVELSLSLGGLYAGEPNLRHLDAESLTLALQVLAGRGEGRASQALTPCALPGRPDRYLEIRLEGGQTVLLRLRYAAEPGAAPVTQARLLEARLSLAGGARHIVDPARLAYDAGRHNWDERFWLILDPPIDGAQVLEIGASGITGRPETRWQARLLGADGQALREFDVGAVRLFDGAPVAPAFFPLLLGAR